MPIKPKQAKLFPFAQIQNTLKILLKCTTYLRNLVVEYTKYTIKMGVLRKW